MIFNANFALIKVTKFYPYYIIVIVLTSEGRVTILILKSSNYNIIEYTISEFCAGGGGAKLPCTLPFISPGFSLSFSKL